MNQIKNKNQIQPTTTSLLAKERMREVEIKGFEHGNI